MNALRILETGAFENLRLTRVPKPTLAQGEALVRVRAAGINASDAACVKGLLPVTTVPRIPGRDFSGEVVEVSDDASKSDWVGAEVWGTGGTVGFRSDGTFAEYVNVPIAKLSHKPKALDHARAASVTLSWQCAWIIVERLAEVKKGENVLILGVRGSIGSNVAQLCMDRGAKVLGTYRTLEGITVPPGVTPILLPSSTDSSTYPIRDAVTKLELNDQIDVCVDCTGLEPLLNDAILAMRSNGTGRMIVMAAHRPDGLVAVNFRTLYSKALTLKGLNSNALSPAETKGVLDYVAERFNQGIFKAAEVDKVPMEDEKAVQEALARVMARSATKRTVILT